MFCWLNSKKKKKALFLHIVLYLRGENVLNFMNINEYPWIAYTLNILISAPAFQKLRSILLGIHFFFFSRLCVKRSTWHSVMPMYSNIQQAILEDS